MGVLAAIDTGDTAWMLVATALVLLMTPALGLFYAGLVRSKNTLNTFMMCIAAIAIAALTWTAVGYSIAFGDANEIFGGFDYAFLSGVGLEPRDDASTIPHLLFFAFQGTFCIITVALISGAVVERMRFGAFLVFAALWSVLVYAVMAHWAFGPGLPVQRGHAGLRRRHPGGDGLGLLGAGGGARGGRAQGLRAPGAPAAQRRLRAAGRGAAVVRLVRLQRRQRVRDGGEQRARLHQHAPDCPAASLIVWFVLDLIRGRTVTAIGAATAIIVGCVLITPAGGFISPGWAILLGAIGAVPCYTLIAVRPRTRVDETLDVLAAHGIAGFTGILFIGFFAQESWNGISDGLLYGNAAQLGDQALAALVAPIYAFVATYVLLRVVGAVMPLRATEHEEALGMDVVQHGEEAYVTGEGAILVTTDAGADGEPAVAGRG